jgi:hypothetical protein
MAHIDPNVISGENQEIDESPMQKLLKLLNKLPKKVWIIIGGIIMVLILFFIINQTYNSCDNFSIKTNNKKIENNDTLAFGETTLSVNKSCLKSINWSIQLGTNEPITGKGKSIDYSFIETGDYKIIVTANNGKISKKVNFFVGSSKDYIYKVKRMFEDLVNAVADNFTGKDEKELISLFSKNGNLISAKRFDQSTDEVNCSSDIRSYINRIKNTKVEIRIDGAELYSKDFDNNGKIKSLELIEDNVTLECGEGRSEEEIVMTDELQALIDIDYRTNPDSFDKLFKAIIDKKHNDILINKIITQVSKKMRIWNIQRDLTYKSGVKLNSKMSLQEFLKSLQGDRTNNISTIKTIKIQKGVKSSKETTNVIIIKKG